MSFPKLAALVAVLVATMIGCTYWLHRQSVAAEKVRLQRIQWAEEERWNAEQDRREREEDRLDELRRIREELEDKRFGW